MVRNMQQYKEEFIEFMVECGVLTFGDFTTKSGRKTPYFVNTGNYRTGAQMARLGQFYAQAIAENFKDKIDILFGPAYKGIPLCTTASIALHQNHGIETSFCFNRKEIKDHGEGGALVGQKPVNGDNILIIEDVTTAGTSIYETVPVLKAAAPEANVMGLIISVDRMEKGKSGKGALEELRENFGFQTASIVNVREIREYLHNREVNGKVLIDDDIYARMEDYLKQYGA